MRVAITAAAVRTALGQDADAIWAAMSEGDTAVGPIQGFDASGFGDVHAAQIWTEPEAPEDDPALRILGPHGRLLDAVALEAHGAAGLEAFPREEVGLFVGMGMVDSPVEDLAAAALASRNGNDAMSLAAFFAGAFRQVHPLWPLSMLNNVAAGQIAIDLDIRGDNVVLASDAAAGARAIYEAAHSVAEGHCRAALAAGVSGRVRPAVLARRSLQGKVDAAGEGGAALVLEREDDARARGATCLGFVHTGVLSPEDHPAWEVTQRPAALGDLEAGGPAVDVLLALARRRAGEADGPAGRVSGGRCALVIEEAA